jgi:hypothetical protein
MSLVHQVLTVLALAFFIQSSHNVGHVTVRLHDVQFDAVEGYLVITEVHVGRHARIPTNDPRNHGMVPDEDVFADKGVECRVWVHGHGKRVDVFMDRFFTLIYGVVFLDVCTIFISKYALKKAFHSCVRRRLVA